MLTPPPPPACPYPAGRVVEIASLRDLPSAVVAGLGAMADSGEPFNPGDVIYPGSPPQRRFTHAEAVGCALTVAYEQGGIGYHPAVVSFTYADGAWLRTTPGR